MTRIETFVGARELEGDWSIWFDSRMVPRD